MDVFCSALQLRSSILLLAAKHDLCSTEDITLVSLTVHTKKKKRLKRVYTYYRDVIYILFVFTGFSNFTIVFSAKLKINSHVIAFTIAYREAFCFKSHRSKIEVLLLIIQRQDRSSKIALLN